MTGRLYLVYLFAARFVLGYIAIVSRCHPPTDLASSNTDAILKLGFNIMSIRVSSAIRLAYMSALLSHRVSLLDTQPPGQLAAIITSTSNTLQMGISEKFAHLIHSIALMIGALCNAFYHSWKLTLVTASGLLMIIIVYCATTPFVVKNMKNVETTNIKASGVASEAFGSVKMIAACGAESKMVKNYENWISGSRKSGMTLSKIIGVQKGTSTFPAPGMWPSR